MNYRHGFHAGNHADVLKHVALVALLGRLNAKDKPWFALDTHGGRGVYDLASVEAQRSGEHRHGVARILAAADAPAAVAAYAARVRAAGAARYPGSPLIVAGAMRARDRLIACELNAGEAGLLGDALAPFARARAETRDGYGAAKALTPPPERRGLVLIDPPFEQADEFGRLAATLRAVWRRWPTGQYLVWYPLKDRKAADGLHQAVGEAGLKDVSTYELYVRAPAAGAGMAGSGLLAVNATYALEPLAEAMPWLCERLAQGAGASWRAQRLTEE